MSLRLLLVEDDVLDRAAVRRALKTAGVDATVVEVEDADAGFAALMAESFDCVLLDYMLPKCDGLEFLRRLRAREMSVPCIVLTGQGDEELASEMMRAGASDYLAKSFLTPDRLERSLRHALRIAAAEAEREQLLANEKAAREDAQAANRVKDEFMATLSHELRTPLNAILGWAQLLQGGRLDEAQTARAVEIIERNARAQAQLIEDLLDISRISTGKLQLDTQDVDVGQLMETVVDSFRPGAAAQNLTLLFHADTQCHITADARRIQQVAGNLITNAIKFTPAGGTITVSISKGESEAVLTVSDTGIGLDPAFIPRAFERFQQAETGSTRQYGGLGLGLNIVRHLVEQHGGSVSVASAGPGQGTTFTVRLPLSAPVDVIDSINGVQTPTLRGIHVLCVDDDADALALMQTLLCASGARVTTARSPGEALQAMETDLPDLLVSDIAMPREDGYALIRAVRSSPVTGIRCLLAAAVTAYATDADRARAVAAGFDAHLPKPIHPADLGALVAELTKSLRS